MRARGGGRLKIRLDLEEGRAIFTCTSGMSPSTDSIRAVLIRVQSSSVRTRSLLAGFPANRRPPLGQAHVRFASDLLHSSAARMWRNLTTRARSSQSCPVLPGTAKVVGPNRGAYWSAASVLTVPTCARCLLNNQTPKSQTKRPGTSLDVPHADPSCLARELSKMSGDWR